MPRGTERPTPEQAAANQQAFWGNVKGVFNWVGQQVNDYVIEPFKENYAERVEKQLTALSQQSPNQVFTVLTKRVTGMGNQQDQFNSIRGTMSDMAPLANNEAFKKHLHAALQNPAFIDKVIASGGEGMDFGPYKKLLATPYGQTAAANVMAEIAADPAALDKMNEIVLKHGQAAFSAHLGTLKPDEVFGELEKASGLFGAGNKLTDMIGVIKGAGPEFQQAFQVALTNPEFLTYLQSSEGSTLLSKETLNGMLADSLKKGLATQLLNQIGTNDIFRGESAKESFERLDKIGGHVTTLGEFTKAYDAAKKAGDQAEMARLEKEIAILNSQTADEMRQLGVGVPEDVLPEIQNALMNILTGRATTQQAMDTLMLQLAEKGIPADAIASLDAMMRPMAGFMDFIVGPYAEFFQKHGPTLFAGIETLQGHATKVSAAFGEGKGIISPSNQEAFRDNLDKVRDMKLGENEARDAADRGKPVNGSESKVIVAGGKKIISEIYSREAAGRTVDVEQTGSVIKPGDQALVIEQQRVASLSPGLHQ